MEEPGFFKTSVGIIGGRGRMGAWWARQFRRAGCRVRIADAKDGEIPEGFASDCAVVVMAVPVSQVEPVMRRIGPHTRPGGLVMDICSLKQGPLKSMLAHARGEVVGAHPLFGPTAEGLGGQSVFLCPGRGERWLGWLRAFLQERGARVTSLQPERHDRLMAQAQSLRHLWLVCLGRALDRLGFDPERDLALSGPWTQELIAMLGHQCTQPAELYCELATHNPAMGRVADALEQTVGEVLGYLRQGDGQGLADLFDRTAEVFCRPQEQISLDAMGALR